MQVTELEYTALIMMSSRENVVQGTFGPQGVCLMETTGNQWAISAVKAMREAEANMGTTHD